MDQKPTRYSSSKSPAGQSSDTLADYDDDKITTLVHQKSIDEIETPIAEAFDYERTTHARTRQRFIGWWWEIGGIFVSIVSFALIIAILLVANNKPLATWMLPIQPNSLVSIFSTVSKSALLVPVAGCISELKWKYFATPRKLSHFQAFDDASRGPWGALTFLLRVDIGGSWLGWIGAMATILSLAFEPFTQQSIQLESREVLLHNVTGYVSQAREWSNVNGTAWKLPDKFDQIRTSAVMYMLDLELYVAVAGAIGFLNNTGLQPTLAAPGFYCPAQICRVPEYMTLAACTKCSPTETVGYDGMDYRFRVFGKLDSKADSFTNLTQQDTKDVFRRFPYLGWANASGTAYSTRRREWPKAQSHWNGSDICTTTDIVEGHQIVPGPLGRSGYYNSFDRPESLINNIIKSTNFKSFVGANLLASDSDPCTTRKVKWDFCAIDLCVESHAPRLIKNGIQEAPNVTRVPFSIIANDTRLPDYLQAVVGDGRRPEQNFQIHREGFAQLVDSVDDINWNLIDARNIERPTDPEWTSFHTAISNYLTGRIQSQRNPNITLLPIDAFESEVYVNVEWPWLALPLLVVIIVTLLLFFTARGSSQQDFLFKSSILAVLFHGWDGGAVDHKKEKEGDDWCETEETLFQKGNNVQAILRRDGLGHLKLVKGD
ncbi:hypothetical protein B0J11DRAFT_183854 [Dendryphion nanum]|uniref:Uncharacterized protein n=1 Tax=Dendryphion nanum TaxID=256645 RepID=A0A9P9D599_9PLEO|nr:hypothetical protein B0J11DRAFT_183854 [Dendryphion nanum]